MLKKTSVNFSVKVKEDIEKHVAGMGYRNVTELITVAVAEKIERDRLENPIRNQLMQAGFDRKDNNEGECWEKVLEEEELKSYFDSDADELVIGNNEVTHVLLRVYPENEGVEWLGFDDYPSDQDVANCHNPNQDDFNEVIKWIVCQ